MLKKIPRMALLLAGGLAAHASFARAQELAKTQATQQQKRSDGAAVGTYRITGRVVNALTGAPVAGAYVTVVERTSSDSNRTIRTGADGGFALTQVPAGRYVMMAHRKGYVEQMYLQHEFYTTAVLVGPSLNSENLVFPLPLEGVISGEVTDEAGDPVHDARMLLFRESTGDGKLVKQFAQQQNTNDEGRYWFGNLARGTYYLAVLAEPWYAQYARNYHESSGNSPTTPQSDQDSPNLDLVYPITYYPNATDGSGASPIRVEAGGSAQADMRLVPVPALHMSLEVDGGGPQTHTMILVRQKILGVYEETQGGRTWQVNSRRTPEEEGGGGDQPSGPQIIELGGLRPGPMAVELMTGEIKGRWRPTLSKSVPVNPSDEQTVDMRGIAAAPDAVVSGNVKLEREAALPQGVFMLLRDSAKGATYRADPGADGSFKFSPETFEPGAYVISAVGPGGIAVRSISATGAKVNGNKIEVTGGGDVQLIVTLARGVNGRVKGIVERDGRPTAGMMVVLVPEDLQNLDDYRRDQSDSDGSFSLNQVRPGKYTVIAVSDWELEWAKPEVIRKYLAGGTSVEVAGGDERDVKVICK
jgi:hypothetical protein